MANSSGTLATLTLDGKEYHVFEAYFETAKKTDDFNRVVTAATYADAKFTIEGKDDTTTIFEKYANSRNRFDAKLVLYSPTSDGQLVETEFIDCSIKSYSSMYTSTSSVPYTLTIVLSPKTIRQGSAELEFRQGS